MAKPKVFHLKTAAYAYLPPDTADVSSTLRFIPTADTPFSIMWRHFPPPRIYHLTPDGEKFVIVRGHA